MDITTPGYIQHRMPHSDKKHHQEKQTSTNHEVYQIIQDFQDSSITIRLARIEDSAVIQEIVEASYSHYISRMGSRPAPMDADYHEIIRKGCTWVLEDTNNICGVVVLVFYADSVLVENVAVRPSYQGLGYGKVLMHCAEKLAVDVGCTKILCYTNEKMIENIAIYQHLGYVITGRATENGFHRVFFEKILS